MSILEKARVLLDATMLVGSLVMTGVCLAKSRKLSKEIARKKEYKDAIIIECE